MTFIVNHISFVLVISDRHSVEQPTFFKFMDQNHKSFSGNTLPDTLSLSLEE